MAGEWLNISCQFAKELGIRAGTGQVWSTAGVISKVPSLFIWFFQNKCLIYLLTEKQSLIRARPSYGRKQSSLGEHLLWRARTPQTRLSKSNNNSLLNNSPHFKPVGEVGRETYLATQHQKMFTFKSSAEFAEKLRGSGCL